MELGAVFKGDTMKVLNSRRIAGPKRLAKELEALLQYKIGFYWVEYQEGASRRTAICIKGEADDHYDKLVDLGVGGPFKFRNAREWLDYYINKKEELTV